MSQYTKYMSDKDMLHLSTDTLIRVWAHDEYPWLSILKPCDTKDTETHHWSNSVPEQRDYNRMELVDALASHPRTLHKEDLEAALNRNAFATYKTKLTYKTLFGTMREPARHEVLGNMDGLINLIPVKNKDVKGAWSKQCFRNFIDKLRASGAFPGNKGILVVNKEAVKQLYKQDDKNTGISWRDTDRPLDELVIRNVRFKVIEEPVMDVYFPDKVAIFLLTPKSKGQSLLNLARINSKVLDEKHPRPLYQTEEANEIYIGQFACLELKDPFLHGFYAADINPTS